MSTATATHLSPTPNVEGPLFKWGSPLRTNYLGPDTVGEPLLLRGRVLDTSARPLPGVVLEMYQADTTGTYDSLGFGMRGHQITKPDGSYRLRTIIPREYNAAGGLHSPHLHARVLAPDGPLLVTQLYFPPDTRAYGLDFAVLNAADDLYDTACLIAMTPNRRGGHNGRFDFIVPTEPS